LTSVEQSLVANVCSGEPLDLIPDVPVGGTIDEDTMRAWGPSQTCSATAIRDILRGQLATDPDPRGLQLRGAKITGRLDLDNLGTKVNFELTDCLLEEGILAREARMASVRLRGCRLEHPTDPPLDAAGLACGALDLSQATIIGHTAGKPGEAGAVRLLGACIRGHLDCTGARLHNDKGPALLADGVRVGLGMFLRRRFTATGAGQDGTVMLRGASVGIHLVCSGASLRNGSGPALSADGLQVAQDMYLDEVFTAAGTVDLTSASISGNLSCRGARLNGRDKYGNALLGERMKVGGDVFLEEKFTTAAGAVCLLGADISGKLSCRGARLNGRDIYGNALHGEGMKVGDRVLLEKKFTTAAGAVSLLGAEISGQLSCRGARLNGTDEDGNALHGEGMKVGRDVFLDEQFTAAGAVSLLGAEISGQLSCHGAQLNGCDKKRNALHGERMKVGGDVLLQEKFTTAAGAVCLLGADISGHLSCRGAQLNGRDKYGNALHGDGIRVGRDVFLDADPDEKSLPRENFTTAGTVSLLGADISGKLSCRGARLRNDSGPALSAESLQVGQDMLLGSRFRALSAGANEAVNLRGAQVGGALVFDPGLFEHVPDRNRRLAADGLTYIGVPKTGSGWDWLDLLRHGTPSYAAQPYQQLAAGYRALGDERQVRKILMAQRDDQLARTQPRPRWTERLWGRITKLTLGYGYQPWRALLFLAAVLAISCVLAVVLGWHGALAQAKATAAPGQPCTVIQRVSVGLDLNLPVGTSLARAACGLPKNAASAAAAWLTTVGWVLRVLAWTFAALFIAGFTGAVRKT
jgi:hypothetical protein